MKPKRIRRKRTKGWKMPENTVYVGRPTNWGNPFRVGDYLNSYKNGIEPLTLKASLEYYENYIKMSKTDNLSELKGKNLACWCALDKPCHADILLKLANQ